jgi:hypothetical protein
MTYEPVVSERIGLVEIPSASLIIQYRYIFLGGTNIPKFNLAKYYQPSQTMSVDKYEYHYTGTIS